jgi:hypothetical protein
MDIHQLSKRRNFLKTAGFAAAGTVAGRQVQASTESSMPMIDFYQHRVSRLVLGSNPISGAAHFNGLLGSMMKEYFTEDNLQKLIFDAHANGINFMQGHYDPGIQQCIEKVRDSGGTFNWMFIVNLYKEGAGPYKHSLLNPVVQKGIKTAKPIALIHHGSQGDDLWQQGKRKFEQVNDAFKRIADMGIIPGMSTHLPETIQYVEDKGWDCRFYMGCFYRVGKIKAKEWKKRTGLTPIGEYYTEEMPEEMCRVLRQVDKPCFGYKILAAGRKTKNARQVESCYQDAFGMLKKNDGVIVGMFPKYKDHVALGAEYTRKHGALT